MSRLAEIRAAPGRALMMIVGSIVATGLLVSVPAEESGRVVKATVQATQPVKTAAAAPAAAIDVVHVRGPQYLKAYADIVGVWTICDGLTRGVRKGMTETPAGCLARLELELVEFAEAVQSCTPGLYAPGREHQLWAAISLAYNIGWPSYCKSTAARMFNARRWAEGCDAFAMWNKAGRPLRVINGLVNRRRREIAICRTGL